ncbi:MAG: glycosyltransferase family 2 protein [bacterium]
MTTPRLSVIILSYGTADAVRPCLESLTPDAASGLVEVILVNNAYPSFAGSELRGQFPWLRFIEAMANDGFAAGNNIGLRHAVGEYLLLLNPDTTVPQGTLAEMLAFMDAHPRVGAATCRVLLGSGEMDGACHRGFPTPWASLSYFLKLDRLFPRSRLFGRYHLTYESLDTTHEIDSPSGCFFLTRRKVVDRVGLLDETFFLYGEDLDWSYRIKQDGWHVMYHPRVSITHLKGMSSGIKGTTAGSSLASLEERERALRAFYDAMRIFYQKHLQHRHSAIVTCLIRRAVDLMESRALRNLTV